MMAPIVAEGSQGTDVSEPGFRVRLAAFYRRFYRLILGTAGVLVVLIAWQVMAVNHFVDPLFTSYPTQIASQMVTYFQTGTGWADLRASGEEFVIGFALSVVVGIPAGIIIGWYKWLDALLDPLIGFLYNAPRIALAPLLVIWFGLGPESKIAIVILTAILPLMISARSAVVGADQSLISMARSYGARDRVLMSAIVLPGAVPAISAGMRIAIGQGLLGVVLAEFIASSVGLGNAINQAAASLNTARLFDAVIIIAVAGGVLTAIFRRIERHFDRWRTTQV
jgi:ABC-type nitrate/sulfonate/bicarbonate transport system permease component